MREKAEKPAKRKLTRNQRKQIEAVIRQAKGDGKNHTVQDSIPFQNMFPDGLCRLEGGTFSKTIAFEDVNYRLAGSGQASRFGSISLISSSPFQNSERSATRTLLRPSFPLTMQNPQFLGQPRLKKP